ncbi:hypothetical protein [Hyphomicrobium sulfonivorans]|uniref:hypothetical protein n=1 Tax=Hyphomicrobium sulfonivorans TaxID=121290 RepID=UPI0018E1794A|nr:hypothetical protein [Hyphomicrobium sulfonivorans]
MATAFVPAAADAFFFVAGFLLAGLVAGVAFAVASGAGFNARFTGFAADFFTGDFSADFAAAAGFTAAASAFSVAAGLAPFVFAAAGALVVALARAADAFRLTAGAPCSADFRVPRSAIWHYPPRCAQTKQALEIHGCLPVP